MEYNFEFPETKEITIVNKRIANTEFYKVFYDGNGHTTGVEPIDANNYSENDNVIVLGKNTINKKGYTFKGWALDKNATVWEEVKTTTPEEKPNKPSKPHKERPSKDKPQTVIEEPQTNKDLHISYLNGYPDKTVKPAGNITRAEVAAIFSRLKLNQEDIEYNVECRYKDEKNTDWYAKYLDFAKDNNIMQGYEDGSFRPNEKITRAEFATVVSRFGNVIDGSSSFEDIKGHWAEKNINAATEKDWINGYPDGTYQPEKDITREEVATMVNKMLSRKIDKEGIHDLKIRRYTDLDENRWSYYDLVEASNSHYFNKKAKQEVLEDWISLLHEYIEDYIQ